MTALAVLVAVLLIAGAVTTAVLISGDRKSTWIAGTAGGSSTTATPTPTSDSQAPGSTTPSSERPPPPPTPTGEPYNDDEEPKLGECIDIARGNSGVAIYRARCDESAATLFLDNIQPEKCPAKFFGLPSLTTQSLCFTYLFRAGDCVDFEIPRRINSCANTTSATDPKVIVRITEVHLGEQTGSKCPKPELFLQVGRAGERGVGCMEAVVSKSAATTASGR